QMRFLIGHLSVFEPGHIPDRLLACTRQHDLFTTASEISDRNRDGVCGKAQESANAHDRVGDCSLGEYQILNLSNELTLIVVHFLPKHMPSNTEPLDCFLLGSMLVG